MVAAPAQPAPECLGEITLTGKNQITLPAAGVRALGLERGDRVVVWREGDRLVLMRRPESWTDYFAGSLTHVFGTDEDTQRFLEEERRGWEEYERAWEERCASE